MNEGKNLVAVARWLIRWSESKPVPKGYRKGFEPNKLVFINGRVLEFPRQNVDKQINIEAFWRDIDIIMVGKPKSMQDKLRVILSEIVELSKDTGMVEKKLLVKFGIYACTNRQEIWQSLQRESRGVTRTDKEKNILYLLS
jgi:hypothetical protein